MRHSLRDTIGSEEEKEGTSPFPMLRSRHPGVVRRNSTFCTGVAVRCCCSPALLLINVEKKAL